jgi:hypothetical protein
MQVTFEISYISTNVALVLGREHLTTSIKQTLVSYIMCDPESVYAFLHKQGGFYADPDTKLIWIPASVIVRVQRMIQ